jgi:hypothetical protein
MDVDDGKASSKGEEVTVTSLGTAPAFAASPIATMHAIDDHRGRTRRGRRREWSLW